MEIIIFREADDASFDGQGRFKPVIIGPFTVSYPSGVFKAGDLISKPPRSYLESSNVVLVKPLLEPILGPALYAVILEEPNKDYPQALFENLKEQQAEGALSEPVPIEA